MNYDTYDLWTSIQTLEEGLRSPEKDNAFVNFRYTAPLPCAIQVVTNYWFDDLKKMTAYIKYVIVRSAIYDYVIDDDNDFYKVKMEDLFNEMSAKEKEENSKYIELWDGICNVLKSENIKDSLDKYLEKFNNEFAHNVSDFEIHVAYGLDEFRKLRIEQCSEFWDEDDEQEFLEATDTENFDAENLADYLLENIEW